MKIKAISTFDPVPTPSTVLGIRLSKSSYIEPTQDVNDKKRSEDGFLLEPVLRYVQVFLQDENGNRHFLNAIFGTAFESFSFSKGVIKVNLSMKFITPTVMTKIKN